MDWIVKKERKKKNLQVLEMSFSCFKPFGVWGVTEVVPRSPIYGLVGIRRKSRRKNGKSMYVEAVVSIVIWKLIDLLIQEPIIFNKAIDEIEQVRISN